MPLLEHSPILNHPTEIDLRDLIAVEAMRLLIEARDFFGEKELYGEPSDIASEAYELADAMLARRGQTKKET